MTSAALESRVRRIVTGLILYGVAATLFAVSVALGLTLLAGVGLLVGGIVSWVHPVDVAAAWARTLGGIGLIGGSAGIGALGWLAVEGLVGPLGRLAHLRLHPNHPARRPRKFVAVVGLLLALICLPFAAAIHVSAHAPWFGW